VQDNTNSSSPLDVGPSFARTRINLSVNLPSPSGKESTHTKFTCWCYPPGLKHRQKEIESFVLEQNTYAKNKQLLSIVIVQDELNLLFSLNTLGYIEFETPCVLSSVEEKFKCAELSWLS
jgi:hypothetical protein